MVCQACGQKEATTYMKQTVNGVSTEMHVCSDCAAKQGFSVFGDNALHVGNLFGGWFAQPILKENERAVRCETCGKSFQDIVQSGRVGCSDCYHTFYKQLLPSIQRIHGKTSHAGKIAADGSNEGRIAREIEGLKNELSKALAAQEYERCATLRDRIKELEGESHE